jgi:hypothetical protein
MTLYSIIVLKWIGLALFLIFLTQVVALGVPLLVAWPDVSFPRLEWWVGLPVLGVIEICLYCCVEELRGRPLWAAPVAEMTGSVTRTNVRPLPQWGWWRRKYLQLVGRESPRSEAEAILTRIGKHSTRQLPDTPLNFTYADPTGKTWGFSITRQQLADPFDWQQAAKETHGHPSGSPPGEIAKGSTHASPTARNSRSCCAHMGGCSCPLLAAGASLHPRLAYGARPAAVVEGLETKHLTERTGIPATPEATMGLTLRAASMEHLRLPVICCPVVIVCGLTDNYS